MRISTVTNNKDTKTVAINNTEELQKIICTHTWSPAIFSGTRSNDNFVSTDLLVLDVDSGATINEAFSIFSGYKIIIAPTRSHQVEKNGLKCDRFRIVLFLRETITSKEDFLATWQLAQSMLPTIDAACKDPARQYFASQYIAESEDGATFPVVRGAIKVEAKRTLPERKYPVPNFVQSFMDCGAEQGKWDTTLFKAAKLLQESGFDEDEAVELLEKMQNPHYTGTLDKRDLTTIKSAYSKPGKYDPKIPWPEVVETRHGNFVPDTSSQRNIMYCITNILNKTIRFNELRGTLEVNGKPLNDNIFADLMIGIEDMKLKIHSEKLHNILRHLANQSSYNPFKEKVESTVWDQQDHIEALYRTFTIQGEELPIYRIYLKRWLIALFARVYDHQANNLLVFLGPQGIKKSRWIQKLSLLPEAYLESHIEPTDKDHKIRATQNVIWNISELDYTTKKKEASAIKAFITDSDFDIRRPFERFSEKVKATCSFIASVNATSFLNDETGSRRFLVIPVEMMDAEHNVNIEQVYAQAYHLYKSGERFWFNQDEIKLVNNKNEDYDVPSQFSYMLVHATPGEEFVSADEVLNLLQFKNTRTRYDYVQLGLAFAKFGFESMRKIKNNVKLTYYKVDRKSLEPKCYN